MKIVKQLTELIGNTPLLELTNYEKEQELKGEDRCQAGIFQSAGKCEGPCCKCNDRAGYQGWQDQSGYYHY